MPLLRGLGFVTVLGFDESTPQDFSGFTPHLKSSRPLRKRGSASSLAWVRVGCPGGVLEFLAVLELSNQLLRISSSPCVSSHWPFFKAPGVARRA